MITAKTITTNVKECSACGQDHANLEFKTYEPPLMQFDDAVYPYWAFCPVALKMVFMMITTDKENDGSIPVQTD